MRPSTKQGRYYRLARQQTSLCPRVAREGGTRPVAMELAGLAGLIEQAGSSVDKAGGVDPEIVQAVLELRSQLPEVDQFAYDRSNGLHFTLPGGTLVYLGQPQGLAGRVTLMKTLQETLVAQGKLPAEINFRHDGGFYYRPAPAN